MDVDKRLTPMNKEIEIFISYSHEDNNLRIRLLKHLRILKRNGIVNVWHDRNIDAGDDWKKVINQHLESAHIILLLVSVNFIDSDYCYEKEMVRALERNNRGEAQVIPIILSPVNWKDTPFSKLQVLPENAKPVTKWKHRDEAFANIANSIQKVAEDFSSKQLSSENIVNLSSSY
jgi:hypothetical protein